MEWQWMVTWIFLSMIFPLVGYQADRVRKDIQVISGALSVTYAKLETIQQEIAELKAMIK